VNTPLVHQYQAPDSKQELAPADPHKMNTVEEIFSISSSITCVSGSSSASDDYYYGFGAFWGFDLYGHTDANTNIVIQIYSKPILICSDPELFFILLRAKIGNLLDYAKFLQFPLLFSMIFYVCKAYVDDKMLNEAWNNAILSETLLDIGFNTLSLMNSTYPSTIWDTSTTSYAHALAKNSVSWYAQAAFLLIEDY
jgi:hypothetical protein